MNESEAASTLDKAVNQLHERGTGRTDEAYWAFRSLARSLADRLGEDEVEDALIETIAEDVASSVRISFVDVPPEMVEKYVDLPDDAQWALFEPTPELVRVALTEDPGEVSEKLAELHYVTPELPDVRVHLSTQQYGSKSAVSEELTPLD
jgi:hypothetical protein